MWPLVGRSVAVTRNFPGGLVSNFVDAGCCVGNDQGQPMPRQAVKRPGSVGKRDQALVVVAMDVPMCLASLMPVPGVGVTESEAIQRFRTEPKSESV